MRNVIGNLIRIALNQQVALGSTVIFTILRLPIHEHDISFHLFMSFLISLISILWFSEYRSFVSLGRFIQKYFLFDVMVNGTIPLISLSSLLLLVYRNSRNFCVLILYPVTLLNSLMSSSSFLVASLEFSMYCICHFQFGFLYYFFFSDCHG